MVVLEGRVASSDGIHAGRVRGATGLEALLDNVRSALNVGSIFRTAEGLGLAHIYLAGITPTPEDTEIRRTSLGAERQVAWSWHPNALGLLPALRERRYKIWALENAPEANVLDSRDLTWAGSTQAVIVVGNEVTGVDPGILSVADRVVRLSMRGRKASFNAAVAFAIAAYLLTTAWP